MSERLSEEQLRDMAQSFNNPRVRAMATELLALRAERAKLEAALRVIADTPNAGWMIARSTLSSHPQPPEETGQIWDPKFGAAEG